MMMFVFLGDVTKILDQLFLHDNTLDAMAKSEYSTHFHKEINYWKKTLSKIGNVTHEWISAQEKWKDLSKAFAIISPLCTNMISSRQTSSFTSKCLQSKTKMKR